VEYIHDELIAELWAESGTISAKGCRDINLLESAVSRPFQTVFGGDAYPEILEKGAALFHSLVANHPFHDGNKRTAVTALYAFFLGNGHYFALSNDEAYSLAKATASYRERGLAHEQAVIEIQDGLRDWVVPFSTLRVGARDEPSIFGRTYETAKELRLLIRKSRLNRLIPSE
jgi:death-on-curing family protein